MIKSPQPLRWCAEIFCDLPMRKVRFGWLFNLKSPFVVVELQRGIWYMWKEVCLLVKRAPALTEIGLQIVESRCVIAQGLSQFVEKAISTED